MCLQEAQRGFTFRCVQTLPQISLQLLPYSAFRSHCDNELALDSNSYTHPTLRCENLITRDVPKVMSNFFLQANWEQQTKESAVVDGTSCCVILECLVTSIACIT